jgi:hypothetical protein
MWQHHKTKKKPLEVQVVEIFDFLVFLVNAKIKCTYAFSVFNVKIIIHQIFECKTNLNTISPINFTNVFIYFYHIKIFQSSYTTSYYKLAWWFNNNWKDFDFIFLHLLVKIKLHER